MFEDVSSTLLLLTSSVDRLPTVQASQALNELQDDNHLYISTGLEELDNALLPPSLADSQNSCTRGGVKRGQVTELWGPPGTGKTAISIQLTANSIYNAGDVVWIDCFQELQASRLEQVLGSTNPEVADVAVGSDLLRSSRGKFIHFSCLTLPHLIALLLRPNAKAIPGAVSLVVVSNVSSLINSSLPKTVEENTSTKPTKGQTASTKRRQGIHFISNALQRLAATKNCAVVVLSQCATRMQSEHGATLVTAINASAWDQGISTRLVMFRDWAWKDGKLVSVFLAGLQKLDGKSGYATMDRVAAFRIDSTGVATVDYDATSIPVEPPDAVQHKRKLEQTDLEVPDSEDDEDYGWADDDEATLPAPPPQWQGSEDVLLGQELSRSDDDRDEDECESMHSVLSEATC
ncbi:hypothetical protein QQS21_009470 [Conoideocrella luteorostrata]|uniref:RecA family profile 1 domain-containing protein n=1 Tax=Conoideocrella luteorostrata TaxID=1105319 RepID=A0AAJ0CHT6_9HYPO|nr:hypothetical protein QQS21_009470 [Conoideocrella luteorostrata]